jgi:Sulfotransferase family
MSKRKPVDPVLVTGMPRGGTTWLARVLASSPKTSMTGREPMNPHSRQFALGGTVSGWARITRPSDRQTAALSRCYRGLEPRVYSRYGRRQWSAPRPRTRVIVKDPFAMLSTPWIQRVTGAAVVLVYRHPGASLASYRRMGWTSDTVEVTPLIEAWRADTPASYGLLGDPPEGGDASSPQALGYFWAALHAMFLADVDRLDDVVVVSHADIATGGGDAARLLFAALGLAWSAASDAEFSDQRGTTADAGRLHNLNRAPSSVAEAWRAHLTIDEVAVIEEITAPVRARLDELRLHVPGG